jgi:hypothetical protein
MIARRYPDRLGLIFLLGFALFVCVPGARADDATPKTRAARLTLAQGSVTVNEPNNAASIPGQVNLPLLSGAQVVTGGDGQAEIEFEDGSVVRLTPNSALSLDTLAIGSDDIFVTDMSLLRGLAYCELRAAQQYSFMLNAGGDVLSPVENTTVRVNFDQPPATFAVLDGTAQVERQGGTSSGYQTQVRAGESLREDTADASRYFLTQDFAADSWDQWNDDLDQAGAASSSNSTAVRDGYAGADGYGWSDLDANGSWYDVPGQGQVWQPQVAETDINFDPYGNGAWVWSGGTGYLWTSGYSWGWTPYHCGNWSYYNGFGWGWAPGAGCGGAGWGFYGGGNPVNIKRFPPGYHPIRVPTPRPGPLRPILPVKPYTASPGQLASSQTQRGPRTIDGQTVSRVAPVRGSSSTPGPVTGSSLRRDFPINAANHSHELGLASTTPNVHPASSQGPEVRQGAAQDPGQHSQPVYGNRGQAYPPSDGYRPAPTSRPELNSPAGQGRSERASPSAPPTQYQPAQRYQPPVQQAAPPRQQRYEPRPPAEHPTYSPPPQQQSRPSPPSEPSHPSYSPRPSPPAAAPPPQAPTPSQPHISPR